MATKLANASSHYAEVLLECITDDLKKRKQRNIQQRARGLMIAEKQSRNASELLQQYIDIVDYDEGLETAGFSHQHIDEQQKSVRAFCKFVTSLNRSTKETLAYIRTLKDHHQQSAHTGGVTLTTFHSSKGFEWSHVILPGLSADNLPYDAGKEISINAPIDSERRLFYVAMTRARRSLWLISPPEPKHEHEERMPSPFLGEIQFELSKLVGHKLHNR